MTALSQIWRMLAARLAAVAVSAAILWLTAHFGFEVTEDQRGQAVSFFTDALTGFGWLVGMVVYPIVHKVLDRKINPLDSAKPTAFAPVADKP
jgi:hypothetical protein